MRYANRVTSPGDLGKMRALSETSVGRDYSQIDEFASNG
jgi:hypothetical protein